jgi:hypothetical protein
MPGVQIIETMNLVAAARANPPGDRVPPFFERRIMAHLTGVPRLDLATQWARALWRAAAPCVGVMLLLVAWSFFTPTANAPATDYSQDFENTLLAVADQDSAADVIW